MELLIGDNENDDNDNENNIFAAKIIHNCYKYIMYK